MDFQSRKLLFFQPLSKKEDMEEIMTGVKDTVVEADMDREEDMDKEEDMDRDREADMDREEDMGREINLQEIPFSRMTREIIDKMIWERNLIASSLEDCHMM